MEQNIALPCAVGDTLFRKDGMWECVGFDCAHTGSWRVKLRQDISHDLSIKNPNNYLYTRMVFGSFGKTVFTSREELEKVFPPKPVDPRLRKALAESRRRRQEHDEYLRR